MYCYDDIDAMVQLILYWEIFNQDEPGHKRAIITKSKTLQPHVKLT